MENRNETDTRAYSQALHNRYNHSREQVDNAMVHIVLGTTLLIVGLLFLFLSNKMDAETFQKHITIKCAEFWVSMVGLAVGGGLLIAGIARLLFQKISVQIPVMRGIKGIQNDTYNDIPEKEKDKIKTLAVNYKIKELHKQKKQLEKLEAKKEKKISKLSYKVDMVTVANPDEKEAAKMEKANKELEEETKRYDLMIESQKQAIEDLTKKYFSFMEEEVE